MMTYTIDIMISVTKQMEAAEANVCRGGLQNENEELQVIHRAMAVAFRMARDAGAAFITKNWVAHCAAETICAFRSEKLAPQST